MFGIIQEKLQSSYEKRKKSSKVPMKNAILSCVFLFYNGIL